MKTITIKNVPPEVHRQLKSQARAHGRSLNREIITTLERMVHSSPVNAAAIGRRAREIRETMGIYLTEKDLHCFKTAGRR